MSTQALTWAFEAPVDPSAAKFLLVALANYADEHGHCYPGQARLARDTGQSERSVRRHLDVLEEQGWVKRSPRRRKNGSRTSDAFDLQWQKTNRPDCPVDARPTGQCDQPNRSNCPNQPANLTGPEPSEEPTEEPCARATRDPGLEGAGDARADGPDTTNECVTGSSPDKPPPANTHWKAKRQELEEAFGSAWGAWLKELVVVADDGDLLKLGAPSKHWVNHVASNYTDLLQSVLQRRVQVELFDKVAVALAERRRKRAAAAAAEQRP